MEKNKKIILFDGVCNLCNGFVLFVIKRDKKDIFRFASLQSPIGKKLMLERHINTQQIDSVVLIEPGVAYYLKSDAALEIGSHLQGYQTLSAIIKLIPNTIRNIVYDFIAEYRYAWFGKKESCMLPNAELNAKFLEVYPNGTTVS